MSSGPKAMLRSTDHRMKQMAKSTLCNRSMPLQKSCRLGTIADAETALKKRRPLTLSLSAAHIAATERSVRCVSWPAELILRMTWVRAMRPLLGSMRLAVTFTIAVAALIHAAADNCSMIAVAFASVRVAGISTSCDAASACSKLLIASHMPWMGPIAGFDITSLDMPQPYGSTCVRSSRIASSAPQ
eukprot:5578749-Prymnesium_polylepis.3